MIGDFADTSGVEMGANHEELTSPESDVKPTEGVSQGSSVLKCCVDCRTTKTPLWRGGPDGPKTLCNACGIRHRKKRRALLGRNKREEKNKKVKGGSSRSKFEVALKLRLLSLGGDVLLRRCLLQKQRKLAEEEEAAVLLMALSCGYASA